MIGKGMNDPWEMLRRSQLDDEPAGRSDSTRGFGERESHRGARRGRAGSFDGADRLWAASAGVLAALGHLVEVAEELCKERAAEPPPSRPTWPSKPSPDPAEHEHAHAHEHDRFEPVMFLDDDPATGADNGSPGGS